MFYMKKFVVNVAKRIIIYIAIKVVIKTIIA